MNALHRAAVLVCLVAVAGGQTPVNDDCAGAIDVFEGVNPNPPTGFVGAQFTLMGATTSVAGCLGSGPDVFFRYVANCAGPVTLSLCPVAGLSPQTVPDAVLSVYDACGGVELACNDDACGLLPELTFAALAGATYFVRVAAAVGSNATGGFYLRVDGDFCLALDAPLGTGSIRIRNFGGPANGAVLTIVTVYPGNFPNGFFYGIDPSFSELLLQIQFGGPPFINVLDGFGNATFGPIQGAPPLTIYAVSLALNSLDQLFDATPPATTTIP
jgi:hypothetical protein